MSRSDGIPPNNLEAERSVLGCCLLDGGKVEAVSDILSDGAAFYSDVHSTIFRSAIRAVEKNNGNVDVILAASELELMGKLNDVGGPTYLLECLNTVPHSAHAEYYAEIVASHHRRRQMLAIGEKLITGAHDISKSDQDVIDDAHDAAMQMAEVLMVKRSRPRLLKDHAFELTELLDRGESPAVFHGIPDVDSLIRGVWPGELIVIGARPGHGKSLLGLQWLDLSATHGENSLMISEEMEAASLASRTLAYLSPIHPEQWRAQSASLRQSAEEHFKARSGVLIAERCSSIASVERTISRAVQSHRIKLVAVDYAQLIDGDGETKEQRVSNVSSRLKTAAMKHSIVIILLAQLNRAVETRDDLTPRISDLKDSGGLEADADVVLLPYCPSIFDKDYENKDEYRVICAKNRSRKGRGEVIEMRCDFARQRILSISESDGRQYSDADVDRFWK
jgi:replicative DNA helicase